MYSQIVYIQKYIEFLHIIALFYALFLLFDEICTNLFLNKY